MQQHSITEKTLEIERRKDILCHGEFVNYWLDFGAKYKHFEKKNGTFGVPYRTVPFLQDCPVFTGLSRFYRIVPFLQDCPVFTGLYCSVRCVAKTS